MKILPRHVLLFASSLTFSACHQQQDAWQTVLAQVYGDGSVSKDTALAAFVLAIGPLPGVPTPPGTVSYIPCGTVAIDWLLQHESELTPGQQRAFRQYLGPAPAPKADQVQQRFQALADIAKIKIMAQLQSNSVPAPEITVVVATNQQHGSAGAYTDGYDAMGGTDGPQTSCKITIEPLLISQSQRVIDETIPHEVFHCFLNSFFDNLFDKSIAPGWLKEGPSEWVGDTIAGHADKCQTCWQHYLTVPQQSLFQRTYDAVGFFAEMQADGLSPWQYVSGLPAAYTKGGNMFAFTQATKDNPTFLDTWATSFVRKPELGGEWDITGPGITTDKYAPQPITVAAGSHAGETLAAAANNDYLLSFNAEVVILNTPDHSRIHADKAGGFQSTTPRAVWCTLPSGNCTCPAGSAHAGETLAPIPQGSYYLGVSGGASGDQWGVQGLTFSDYCNSSRIDPCLFGSWTVQRATIFDGLGRVGCNIPEPFGATLTIARDGTLTYDFNPVPTIVCEGGSQTFKTSGQVPGKVDYANHGLSHITVDASGIVIDEMVQGMDLGPMTLGSILGVGASSDFTSYQCTTSTLSLTLSNGQNTTTLSR